MLDYTRFSLFCSVWTGVFVFFGCGGISMANRYFPCYLGCIWSIWVVFGLYGLLCLGLFALFGCIWSVGKHLSQQRCVFQPFVSFVVEIVCRKSIFSCIVVHLSVVQNLDFSCLVILLVRWSTLTFTSLQRRALGARCGIFLGKAWFALRVEHKRMHG